VQGCRRDIKVAAGQTYVPAGPVEVEPFQPFGRRFGNRPLDNQGSDKGRARNNLAILNRFSG